MRVLINTSPLSSGHALRGIGMYTRLLVEELEKNQKVTLLQSNNTDSSNLQPELIHYPFFDLFYSTLPFIKSRPTVVTVHDVIPLKFPKHYQVGLKGRVRFIKQKASLKRAHAVITDSEASKKDIIKHLGIKPSKIHVVYLAAHPQLQAASEDEIKRVRRKYSLPQQYILYVGDINYNKNLPQLIKAVRYLPINIKLVMVGKNFELQEIPEWQWIETQLALSAVERRVKFVTDVSSDAIEDLAAIYSGAQCYVQPSLYEGFGLPVIEAMQCCTPVVATSTSSLPEVGGEHAVYCETNAESIADAVNQALGWTEAHRSEVVKAAYTWSQQFSWKKTADKTIEVYSDVLGK